jgi:hypothetical protein
MYTCPSDFTSANGYPTTQVNNWGGSSYAPNQLLFGSVGSANTLTTATMQPYGGVNVATSYPRAPSGNNWNTSFGAQFNIGNITDGTMNTVAAAEVYQQCTNSNQTYRSWNWENTLAGFRHAAIAAGTSVSNSNAPLLSTPQFKPTQANCNPFLLQTPHDTIQVLMMDGAVRNTSSAVPIVAWQLALHPADGQPLPSTWN